MTPQTKLTIWTNANFPPAVMDAIKQGVAAHSFIQSTKPASNILSAGERDDTLSQADIAFGQPDPQQVIASPKIKWVHLTTAGYTRYDTPEFRNAMKSRNTAVTNSSAVFAEPCAQHLLAFIMAGARRLPQAFKTSAWPQEAMREQCCLLEGQFALIYGYGSIARRLAELLAPLKMKLTGVRRTVRGDETIPTVTLDAAESLLPVADHVIDILPASCETEYFFNADRLPRMKPSAIFYNIGRGSTVDQIILQEMLETCKIAAAYLDVTTPEPLSPDSILWRLDNCFITPHTAGGHSTEFQRSAQHFLDNLKRYIGNQPLNDRII
jgi:phosphoglycerate dehydrogenase-like enzyme